MNKQRNKATVIDVSILSNSNIGNKELEKLVKYRGMREEQEKMWKMTVTVVSVLIETLRAVDSNPPRPPPPPQTREGFQQILGTTFENFIQKSGVLGTPKILSRTLKLQGLW